MTRMSPLNHACELWSLSTIVLYKDFDMNSVIPTPSTSGASAYYSFLRIVCRYLSIDIRKEFKGTLIAEALMLGIPELLRH
jgi:hypothetical protein